MLKRIGRCITYVYRASQDACTSQSTTSRLDNPHPRGDSLLNRASSYSEFPAMHDLIPRRKFLTAAAGGALAAGLGAQRNAAAAAPRSNDGASLIPVTNFNGPALAFDFPALHVGVAEYAEGPTGCTVLHFPKGAAAAIDIRGGAPGTIWTDQLHEGDGFLHAIAFAGGSLYGLEAAAGVSAELFARRGYATGWEDIALVSGAIIFDFVPRSNAVYPDKALGRAALAAARTGSFPLGPRGAGASATVGKWLPAPHTWELAGQGGAFRTIGATRLAVFTVVNSLGAIVNRQGHVVRGHLDPKTGQRAHLTDPPPVKSAPPRGNTCLTAVVTNQKLDARSLRQLARQVHGSMSRAIEPFNTPVDGDVLYAVTTNEVAGDHQVNEFVLAAAASELAWDAVLASCGTDTVIPRY
jgi:L-aminopeptidase/D-esterase-like protein